jgi:hypothetical protein
MIKGPPRMYRCKLAFGNYVKGQIIPEPPGMVRQILLAKQLIELAPEPPPPAQPAALLRPPIAAAPPPVSRQIKGYMDRKR